MTPYIEASKLLFSIKILTIAAILLNKLSLLLVSMYLVSCIIVNHTICIYEYLKLGTTVLEEH